MLPNSLLVGLDLGGGTGRYSRLLHALLPDGSRLAASDVASATPVQHPERLSAQVEGRHYSTFSLDQPDELRQTIAVFLARLPPTRLAGVSCSGGCPHRGWGVASVPDPMWLA
jgi:hypothetical protein